MKSFRGFTEGHLMRALKPAIVGPVRDRVIVQTGLSGGLMVSNSDATGAPMFLPDGAKPIPLFLTATTQNETNYIPVDSLRLY